MAKRHNGGGSIYQHGDGRWIVSLRRGSGEKRIQRSAWTREDAEAILWTLPARSLSELFWERVDKSAGDDGCWTWTGCRDRLGYGSIGFGGFRLAHRYAYTERYGAIPDGLVLDHLCCNPPCVNPAHLEPVTLRENFVRGIQRKHEAA